MAQSELELLKQQNTSASSSARPTGFDRTMKMVTVKRRKQQLEDVFGKRLALSIQKDSENNPLFGSEAAFKEVLVGQDLFNEISDIYGKDATRKAFDEFLGKDPAKDIADKDFRTRVTESAALIQGGKPAKEARVLTLAALKPEIGADKARFARLRSTQRQRAAQAGASQTVGTTPQGLFDPAHLARRRLTNDSFFRGGLS